MTTAPITELSSSALAGLRESFAGELVFPADPSYDERRRVWNRMVDKRPALIARCTTAADVQAALGFALEHDFPVSIRGGGHNVAGSALVDGGLVMDCTLMNGVRVDPATRLVEVEPGVVLGELDAATAPFGLAVPAGIVTETGVAGLTLGGGIGWLMRRDGLTCDRLRALDIVTADGELRRVDTDTNADLLWALRGGGGNFGIVTHFVFEAVPLGPVTAGIVLFPIEEAGAVLRRYRDVADNLPREATTILALRTVLALPAMPTELHGRRVLTVGFCHAGAAEEGERLGAALAAMGTPPLSTIGPKAFTAHQQIFDTSVPAGLGYYWKSHFLSGLSDGAIDALVEGNSRAPQPWSYTIIFQLRGAIRDLADDATAYPDRDAGFAININAVSETPSEDAEAIAWAREVFAATEPFSTGGVYVNFVGNEGEERARAAYGASYRRLAGIKARWDPQNVFRANQNVRPAAPGRTTGD
jgi:FAD/FMN-containing dehydrogenase